MVEAIGKALQAELRDLNRYPDRDAVALRTDLAGYLGHGLTAANVWAANGSNEVQQQLLQAFGGPGRTALGFGPSYSMHPLLAAGTGTRVDRRAARRRLRPDPASRGRAGRASTRPTWCSSARRTTRPARRCDPEVVDAVLDAAPGMVVVDEAYAEFARPGHAQRARPAARAPAAGGHPHDEQGVRLRRRPARLPGRRPGGGRRGPARPAARTTCRALTQAAARAALAHRDALLATVEAIKEQRDRIVATLRARGCRVADSDANFVLFEVGGDQQAAWQRLLDRGVLVRDVGLPGWLRVTAGTPAETDAFLDAAVEIRVSRTARVERVTKETKVLVEIDLDGTGQGDLTTGVGFYDHMLNQIAKHGGFDLTVRTEGDLEIDAHHTMEDTAHRARRGVRARRSATRPASGGTASPPSRWTRCSCRAAVDLSGRPYVVHDEPALAPYIGPVYPTSMTRHIFESFGLAARVTLHVSVLRAARDGGQPGRPPRGGGAVQGVRPGAARGRRDRPAQRRRAAVHEGRAVMRRRRSCCSALAGILVGGVISLSQPGRHQVQRRPGRRARRARRRPAAWPGCCRGTS